MGDPLVGAVLGRRYRVERKLGSGGMGAVYAAVHLELGRPVAVKTLLEVRDDDDLARFRTEALAAASLAHPHIVSVSDFAPASGDAPAFMVMELLAGSSLRNVLAERGALPEKTAVHIALQMLDALDAAHVAQILHRDVKPANIIVLDGTTPDTPWVKIVDFGIAKLMNEESRHTTTGTLLGTLPYMAPEQLLAQKPSMGVDIWSTGVCLFEMLTGERPFKGKGGDLVAAITRAQAPRLPARIRAPLAAVVTRALLRDPNERYASARDMAEALKRALTATTTKRRRWPMFVVPAIVTIAIGATVLAAFERTRPTTMEPDAAPSTSAIATLPPAADGAETSVVAEPISDVGDAASVSKPHLPPSVCRDGNNNTLCPDAGRQCRCRSSVGGVLCPTAWNDSLCRTDEFYSATAKQGDPCKGLARLSPSTSSGGHWYEQEEGTLSCWDICLESYAVSRATPAVRGTPCRAWYGTSLRPGKWAAPPR